MKLKENENIPNSEVFIMEGGNPVKKQTEEFFKNKKFILFGLPGAFTSVCSAKHLPGYLESYEKYKKNGTPEIIKTMEQSIHFETITGNSGDLVFFSNRCPHRSSKNNSLLDRRTLYYTYNPQREGNHYSQYFVDKIKSRSPTIKSLSGEI